MSPARVFTPLNGEEVKKMILKEIENELDLDGDFRQHITYPTLEWDWTLRMECQQRTPTTLERHLQGSVETVSPETKKPVPLPPDAKRISKIRGKGRTVTTPDRDRAASDMPVFAPKNVEGVGIVDVPHTSKAHPTEGGGRGAIIKNRAAVGFRLDE